MSLRRPGSGASVLRYGGLLATDASGRRLPAWWSVDARGVDIRIRDEGARYPVRIDPFIQQGAKLVGTGGAGETEQGYSVALSADGNTALIGGPGDHSTPSGGFGAAWVFTRSGSSWSQQGPKLVVTGATGQFPEAGVGVALSSDGNTAVIGGLGDTGGIGAAWVFTRSGSTWSQQGSKLVGTGAVGEAEQGRDVALSADGNTALIGGPGDNNFTGAVWVFTRSGTSWSQQGPKLVGTGAGLDQSEGWSVALSDDGNTALLGGPQNTGATWVFTRSGSTWSQQGPKLVGSGVTGGGAAQGLSVALSGDGNTALIGGPNDDGGVGAAWVFTRSGATWSQQGAKLVGGNAASDPGEGSGVALSDDGNTAVIGGPYDTTDAGAAWAFTRTGSSWTQLRPKLVGTGAVGGIHGADRQGSSVALSGDGSTILSGGILDNSGIGATWVFALPRIASLSPTSGITSSHVTINGMGLTGSTSVKFGGLAASFTVVSDSDIDAVVPNGASSGKVVVSTPGGTVTSPQTFTPTLSITRLAPPSGPVGTVVAVLGVGFAPGATVKFNGTAASTSFVNSTEVMATVPSAATSGPVTLTNTGSPAGTVQSAASYTVTPPVAPTVTSFSPGSGVTGSLVTITGTGFSGASSVKFGSTTANFNVVSATQIRATVPNGAVTAPITVTTAAGSATSSTSFTPTLSITGFSPGSGPPGTVVDIAGVGFTPGSTVNFNGTSAAPVTYISPSEVKATVPAGATTGLITLTNTAAPAGTAGSARKYGVT